MSERREPPRLRLIDSGRLKAQFQWEPRDLWIGLFWRRTDVALHVYLCLVPCLPFHVVILWPKRPPGCEGEGCCHGLMSWCEHCGDVGDVCEDADRCDAHRRCDDCGGYTGRDFDGCTCEVPS